MSKKKIAMTTMTEIIDATSDSLTPTVWRDRRSRGECR
jgi:hypothetical protein